MADLLSKGGISFPCGCRSSSVSLKERSPAPFFSIEPVRYFSSSSKSVLPGKKLLVENHDVELVNRGDLHAVPVKMELPIGKAMRWWEKGMQPNMKEITSAEDLADSLKNAGHKLVVVDFFSPGCAGCRTLHPKICQLSEMNPDLLFLQVNYEKHKSMCYSLNVHVLPFFRFYRGSHGRLCSFSCTIATIKKFKDALAKHNTESSSLGPAKGLDESELLALAANRDLAFSCTNKEEPETTAPQVMDAVPAIADLPHSPVSMAT